MEGLLASHGAKAANTSYGSGHFLVASFSAWWTETTPTRRPSISKREDPFSTASGSRRACAEGFEGATR